MRILVTGCTGFAGGYLIEELAAQGHRTVFGLHRGRGADKHSHLSGKLAGLVTCDLNDRKAIVTALADVQPEWIFHLAGYAHVGRSFQEADAAWEANLTATRNLYEAILCWGGRPRILYVGSGLVYGAPSSDEQLTNEDCPLHPENPYAASKAAADLASYQYLHASGLEIIRVRPFNHIGPRQSPDFAVPHFARQLAAIEQGLQPPILETGDLSVRRDLTDVRDMVRAYVLLMERGQRGDVYNAGTGQAHTLQSVLDRLLALAGVRVEVRQVASLLRAKDTAALRADAGKLRHTTGWAPSFTLDQTLMDILQYWRSAAAQGGQPTLQHKDGTRS
jgi:GDP-4-dehydro-6-deoxy-D-mannose reductase